MRLQGRSPYSTGFLTDSIDETYGDHTRYASPSIHTSSNYHQDEILIIGSHQARIRCLMRNLYPSKWNPDVERFRNGAVIKIIITSGGLTSELLYVGRPDPTPKNKVHYNIASFNDRFNPTILNKSEIPIVPEGVRFTIYLVRHGEALHNTMKQKIIKNYQSVAGVKDTTLSDLGIEQAKSAGEEIGNDIRMDSGSLSLRHVTLYSSDLLRTMQTIFYAASILDLPSKNKVITILPCNHEISSASAASCDGFVVRQGIVAQENKQICGPAVDDPKCLRIFEILRGNGFRLNWTPYCSFYGNKTRNGSDCSGRGLGLRLPFTLKKTNNVRRCRYTNLLKEATSLTLNADSRSLSALPKTQSITRRIGQYSQTQRKIPGPIVEGKKLPNISERYSEHHPMQLRSLIGGRRKQKKIRTKGRKRSMKSARRSKMKTTRRRR